MKKFFSNFFFVYSWYSKMSFLIIHKNDSTACLYSKSFMLFRFTCNFFKKKLCHNMSAFFCVMRVVHHLRQSLNNIVVSEQQHCSALLIYLYQFNHLEDKLVDILWSDHMKFFMKYQFWLKLISEIFWFSVFLLFWNNSFSYSWHVILRTVWNENARFVIIMMKHTRIAWLIKSCCSWTTYIFRAFSFRNLVILK